MRPGTCTHILSLVQKQQSRLRNMAPEACALQCLQANPQPHVR